MEEREEIIKDKSDKQEKGWNLDNSYTKLSEKFYTKISPTPVKSPKLVLLNEPLAKSLGFQSTDLRSDKNTAIFGGNTLPEGACPLAQAYAGHQYGYFTMLGDGRAILLGEQITPQGERVDIQLKGSGKTPYSRRGDGRAVLGPMLREYIISEAMYALGIPTTRSLAVTTTGEMVFREKEMPGAILTRVAASHIRVGTFQYAAKWCSKEELKSLADYTIKRHYPMITESDDCYFNFLKEVIKRQAQLIAKWQLVGFVHGVMNTDNMTINGETIDYGPCAFLDAYDLSTVFSSIDTYGRYAYGNQPEIAAWNLSRFAETLLPFLSDNHDEAVKLAEEAIGDFSKLYHCYWFDGMRAKLGLSNQESDDITLVQDLLNLMEKSRADYTNTFRELTLGEIKQATLLEKEEYGQWHKRWLERLQRQNETKESIEMLMKNNNPAMIPRNHRVEEALDAAVYHEDYEVMEQLLDALSDPFRYTKEQDKYAEVPTETGRCYRTYCGT